MVISGEGTVGPFQGRPRGHILTPGQETSLIPGVTFPEGLHPAGGVPTVRSLETPRERQGRRNQTAVKGMRASERPPMAKDLSPAEDLLTPEDPPMVKDPQTVEDSQSYEDNGDRDIKIPRLEGFEGAFVKGNVNRIRDENLERPTLALEKTDRPVTTKYAEESSTFFSDTNTTMVDIVESNGTGSFWQDSFTNTNIAITVPVVVVCLILVVLLLKFLPCICKLYNKSQEPFVVVEASSTFKRDHDTNSAKSRCGSRVSVEMNELERIVYSSIPEDVGPCPSVRAPSPPIIYQTIKSPPRPISSSPRYEHTNFSPVRLSNGVNGHERLPFLSGTFFTNSPGEHYENSSPNCIVRVDIH